MTSEDPTPARFEDAASSAAQRRQSTRVPSVEELQTALPDYDVTALLATSGLGAVYQGVQRSLRRPVAIKVLSPTAGDPQYAARFRQEARAMAKLSHPNIVPVHDYGETREGLLYFVMDFVEGTSLDQILKQEGRLMPRRAALIISQVCEALEFAHEHGIIHRDIKPSSLILDAQDRVKVTGFGLARQRDDGQTAAQTLGGVVIGTQIYISPEQALGKTVDHRTDIYSLGAMFYEMLTGEPPHGAIEPPSQYLELDVRLDRVVLKALARDPVRRYQHAGEVRSDISEFTLAKPPAAAGSTQQRRPVLGIAAAVLLVAILAGIWGYEHYLGGDAHRRCAELARSHGARVQLQDASGKNKSLTADQPLPEGPWRLLDIIFNVPTPNNPTLSSDEIIRMCQAPDLRILSFFQTKPELSDGTFAAFGALRSLRELNFNSPKMSDEWLRHLSGSTSLALLRIPQSNITDAGLAHLASVPSLTEVDFNNSRITGSGIAAMKCAAQLKVLKFGGPERKLTEADLSAVSAACTRLETLALRDTHPEALRHLSRVKNLRQLVLDKLPLTAAHFQALEGSSIRHVTLVNCPVAEEAWPVLAGLKQVDTVQFTAMRWVETAGRELGKMPSLRTFVIADGYDEDVLNAQRALPTLVVKRIGNPKKSPGPKVEEKRPAG